MSICNNAEIQTFIKKLIDSNSAFLIGRLGNSEMRALVQFINSRKVSDIVAIKASKCAGIYWNNAKNKKMNIEKFCLHYRDAIDNTDAMTTPGLFSFPGNYGEKYYAKQSVIIQKRWLEPSLLLPLLENKKILVISPFSNTIKKQFKKKELLFTNFKYPDFKLVCYTSYYSILDNKPHSGWFETFNTMCNDIKHIDFDIAIVGCGGYGMPLANFIKNVLHKSSICSGGYTAAYFGIKYTRMVNQHKKVGEHPYINKHWVYPAKTERPKKFNTLEGGCYW